MRWDGLCSCSSSLLSDYSRCGQARSTRSCYKLFLLYKLWGTCVLRCKFSKSVKYKVFALPWLPPSSSPSFFLSFLPSFSLSLSLPLLLPLSLHHRLWFQREQSTANCVMAAAMALTITACGSESASATTITGSLSCLLSASGWTTSSSLEKQLSVSSGLGQWGGALFDCLLL